jgi:hypothetical protein
MNTKKLFGIDTIGAIGGDRFKASFNGLAIKNDRGEYVTYDAKTNTITNVGDLVFDGFDTVFAIPTPVVTVGDLILRGDEPMYVKAKNDDGSLVIVNPINDREETYLPQKMLFGFRIYVKVFSLFSSFVPKDGDVKDGNQLQNLMLPLAMMGGFSKDGKADGGLADIIPFMMMSNMAGGNADANPLASLFGGADASNPMTAMLPLMLLGGKGDKGGLGDMLPLMLLGGGNLFGGAAPAASAGKKKSAKDKVDGD